MAGKKRTALARRRQTVALGAAGIDQLSQLTAGALTQAGADRKDVVRLRLAVEEILALWERVLGGGTPCVFRCGTRLGRMYIYVTAEGRRVDPGEMDSGEAEGLLCSGLLAQAGLSLTYTYKDGVNRLEMYPAKPRRLSSLAQLVLSIAAAAAVGLLCLSLPEEARNTVTQVVDPLFSAMMGLLQTLASPMIFLSVCWGIVGIGDARVLGRIGRTVLAHFLLMMFVVTGAAAACLIWFFHAQGGTAAQGSGAAAQIYTMLLGIIPSDIISPFLEGNSLQIIFLAVCVGLALLVLGDKASAVRAFVDQVNLAVQAMMETVSRFIPAFTFVSLLSLLLSDALSGLGGVFKGVLLGIAACVLLPVCYALAVCLRLKVRFSVLAHKQLPAYLIALATASSSAALSTNLETCERRLGISSQIGNFAVPLGQVVFKTGGAVGFLLLAVGLGEFYGVAMPLSWVITGVLVAVLVAIAAPPIPGGYLSGYTVLLAQLGIPEEAIALAIAGNVILDFFMTSCGIACLQSELTLAAHRLGMLDLETLRKGAQT